MSFVIYVIDCETTGVDPILNDVIEVSLWRLKDDQQKTWQIKALNAETISDKALKINGHKREDILLMSPGSKDTYRDPASVVSEIEVWMMQDEATVEDRVFLGHNSKFDFDFLKELWKKAGSPDTFPFGYFLIDTIQLTKFIDLCSGKRRARYNLGSLVKDFGVTKASAHRAEGDVKMTRDLFLKQFEPIKDFIAQTFGNSYSMER